jgi:hypothetical protein
MDVIAIRAPFCGERPFEAGAKSTAAKFRAEQGLRNGKSGGTSARAAEKCRPLLRAGQGAAKATAQFLAGQEHARAAADKSGGKFSRRTRPRKSGGPVSCRHENRSAFGTGWGMIHSVWVANP